MTYTHDYSFSFNEIFFNDSSFPFALPSDFTWIKFYAIHVSGIRYTGRKLSVKILNEVFGEIENYLSFKKLTNHTLNNYPRFQFMLKNIHYPHHDLRTYCLLRTGCGKGTKVQQLERVYIACFRSMNGTIQSIPPLIKRGNLRWIQ